MNKFLSLFKIGLFLYLASCGSGEVGNVGQTGSLARFAIFGNHLYAVNNKQLRAFDISTPENTIFISEQKVDPGIETVFNAGPYLFVGGQLGLYIYDLPPNPAAPTFISQFSHARACDPVVVDNNYAFITLRSSDNCPGSVNELKVLDVTDIEKPNLVKNYPLAAPVGLAANSERLYICDGNTLKLFDSSDVNNITLKNEVEKKGCLDVIYNDGFLVVTSSEGITQYDVSGDTLFQLSHLGF